MIKNREIAGQTDTLIKYLHENIMERRGLGRMNIISTEK